MKKLSSRKRITLFTLSFCIIVFGLIQINRPQLDNPPITGAIQAPDSVKAILKRACFDCHSNETQIRWFDKIQPAYSMVYGHIKQGRSGLNFSTWDSLSPVDQKAKLFESVNQVLSGDMPLSSYALVHPSAKLSANDINVLKNYVGRMSVKNKADDPDKIKAAEAQYQKLKGSNPPISSLPKALNGITFIPEYKQWTPISTTDRLDNGTMRVIFGNDAAVEAIKKGKTNPWPDGVVLAKAAWDQLEDSSGNVQTGAFKQVEFMIKNHEKYSSTQGWGWARFKTPEHIAYGKNISFANECVNCHRPLKGNDFVFTIPVKEMTSDFKTKDGKIHRLMLWNSSINKIAGTMSTVYSGGGIKRIMTWTQQDDPHWFGAKIPGRLIKDEVSKVTNINERPSLMP